MARKWLSLGVASGLSCLVPVKVMAQSTAPTGSVALDSVVVTAQKQKEDIKEVPLSVSVITGEQLQDRQIENFADLSRNIPNVSFSTQAGPGLSTIELRGVSSQAGSATVGIYLDEVSLTTRNLYSQGTAEPRFFDIDRVEVLRGPQGTLYGAGSLGGTIRFISNQPDLRKLEGNAEADVSTTDHGGTNYQVQGILNIPLIQDRIGLRIGVQQGHDSGYIDQVDPATLGVISKGINSNDWTVVKLSVKALIAPGWTLTPALFAQDYKAKDIDASYLDVGSYQPTNAGVPLPIFQTSKIVREPSTDKLTIPSLTLNGDVGFADFTGVASSYTRRFVRVQDGTYINSSYIGTQVTDPVLGAQVGNLPSAVQLDNGIDQTSLELRLASKPYDAKVSPVTWIGGFFYSRTKTNVKDNEPVFGINAAFQSAGQDITNPAFLAGAFPNDFPADSSYYSARHYDDKQESLFGEGTYHFSDYLRVIAGVRYLTAQQGFTREGNYYFAGGPTSTSIDSSTNAVTPRFAVDWDIDRNNTAYLNIAKGFRLGAANRPIPDTSAVEQDLQTLGLPGTPATFKPDSLWSYEVGTKSRLMDNRVSFNTSFFYIDWKDIQQDVTLPVSGYDFETNVGRATSYGAEFEARARMTPDLTLSAGTGWTHAVFAEDVPALGTDANGNLNVRKGDPIEGVPRYNVQLNAEYHFLATSSIDGVARLGGQWTGSSHGTFVRGQSDYMRPGYFTSDASAEFAYGKYDLTFYVKNLTNQQAILQQPSIQSVNEAYRLRPRTIGVLLSGDL